MRCLPCCLPPPQRVPAVLLACVAPACPSASEWLLVVLSPHQAAWIPPPCRYQQATRDRAKVKTEGGQIIRVEAHPIPGEQPQRGPSRRHASGFPWWHASPKRTRQAHRGKSCSPQTRKILESEEPHPWKLPVPMPAEHPRPRRVKGRVTLVGDAAGYVTKCSGEGIYFAAK